MNEFVLYNGAYSGPQVDAAVSRAREAAESYIRFGPERTMDRYNADSR